MRTLISSLALAFFAFILWIIYQADAGASNLFLDFVRRTPYADKVGHLGLFGLLTLLVNLASACRGIRWQRLTLPYGTLAVLSFVLLEELSQYFFPSRTLDGKDLLADALGIAAFTWLSLVLHRQLTGRRAQA